MKINLVVFFLVWEVVFIIFLLGRIIWELDEYNINKDRIVCIIK